METEKWTVALNKLTRSLDQSLDWLGVASEKEWEGWDYSRTSDLWTWMDGVILEEDHGVFVFLKGGG